MRASTRLIVSSLFAFCAAGAHLEADGQPFTVLKTPQGYMFVWNESKAHFTLDFKGQKIRPSDIEGVAFFLDERLYQILTVDPSGFAAGETSAKAILDRHMNDEVSHWQSTLGMEMPNVVHERSESPERSYMLWEIRWTEQARNKVGTQDANVIKQLFLSAIAGDRVVVVSRTVLEGENADAALSELSAVAQSLVVKDSPVDIEAIQRQIRGSQ